VTFASLGLRKPILDGVRKAGYTTPSEIQLNSIPIVLDGHDIVSCGETGSGKTAAFGLPMLDKLLDHEPGLRGLVLVPTRELCVQVAENLRIYASRTDIAVCTAFGGVDMGIQEAAIRRGCDIIVACPGRMITSSAATSRWRSSTSWSSTRRTGCSTWASCRRSPAS
jgi:superfamily II DNA/RNA helicase